MGALPRPPGVGVCGPSSCVSGQGPQQRLSADTHQCRGRACTPSTCSWGVASLRPGVGPSRPPGCRGVSPPCPEAVQEWVAEQNWSLSSLPSLGTLGPFPGQGQMQRLHPDTSQELGRDRWDHGGCGSGSICRGADLWPWGLGHGQRSAQRSSQHRQRRRDIGCHPQHRWSLRRREAVYKEEFVTSPFLQ